MARRPKKPKRSYAGVRSVSDLSNQAVKCHSWRHGPWETISPAGYTKPEVGQLEVQRCSCGTVRRAAFSRATGEQLSHWSYEYPDNYRVVGEVGVELADYRRRYFKITAPQRRSA